MDIKDWKTRKLMLSFLGKVGWMPSLSELKQVIEEYDLESDWNLFLEMEIKQEVK